MGALTEEQAVNNLGVLLDRIELAGAYIWTVMDKYRDGTLAGARRGQVANLCDVTYINAMKDHVHRLFEESHDDATRIINLWDSPKGQVARLAEKPGQSERGTGVSIDSESRWYLIDTVEGGPYWVLGKTLNEALAETGTWATGFSYTGHSIAGDALSIPASVPDDDSATKDGHDN